MGEGQEPPAQKTDQKAVTPEKAKTVNAEQKEKRDGRGVSYGGK